MRFDIYNLSSNYNLLIMRFVHLAQKIKEEKVLSYAPLTQKKIKEEKDCQNYILNNHKKKKLSTI